MKRYDKYKESGISWIGEIPEHWEVRKIKYVFTERSEKGYPNEPILCSTQKYGVIPQSIYENRVVEVNKGHEGLKLVKEGNFVISLRSFQGGIEYAYYRGIISAAYTVLELNNDYNSEYMRYLLKSFPFIQLLQTCVTGIREGQNINYALLRKNFLLLPPLSEQEMIVAYLEEKVAQMDNLLAKQEAQIAYLRELKQAIIAKAVIQGIDPQAPLRPSGIPWIGNIPEHWERQRCKDILTESKEQVGDKCDSYTLLSLTINGVVIRNVSEGKGKYPKDFETYKVVNPGNLIFCLFDVDETPRTVGYAHHQGMITGAYNVFFVEGVSVDYLCYYFISLDDRKALKPLYKGLRKVVPLPTFMSMPIYLPPPSEQEAIVAYINRKTEAIDSLIAMTEQEIARIRELKQTLIADIVTGRINVQPS
jgi:probable type I restriction-modification system